MLTEDEYTVLKQHIVQRAQDIDNRVLIITLGTLFKLLESFVEEKLDELEVKND